MQLKREGCGFVCGGSLKHDMGQRQCRITVWQRPCNDDISGTAQGLEREPHVVASATMMSITIPGAQISSAFVQIVLAAGTAG